MLYSTLLEGYSLALYKLGIRVAQRWLAEIERGSVLVNPVAEDYQSAARLLLEFDDQFFSLFDTLLTVVSRRLALAVWTFDHHFDVMHATIWRR